MDFTQLVLDLNGIPMKDGEGVDLTYQAAALAAVLSPSQSEKDDYSKKLKKYKLASKLASNAQCELSLEEKDLIKDVGTKMYSPLMLGRMCEFLYGSV